MAPIGYLNKNLREKYWAQKAKRLGAGEGDIVVMHPAHVAGFLKQANLPRSAAVFNPNLE
jgi:ABC-type uncharacterized transport system YnjBCD substrate-binding protein